MPDLANTSGQPNPAGGWTRHDEVVYVRNWENARHLPIVRVLSANAFAVVIAACLAALQFVRTDRLMELTLVGLALKRELEDCMACIERPLADLPVRDAMDLRQATGNTADPFHLRWLYSAFYAATLAALFVALVHRGLV